MYNKESLIVATKYPTISIYKPLCPRQICGNMLPNWSTPNIKEELVEMKKENTAKLILYKQTLRKKVLFWPKFFSKYYRWKWKLNFGQNLT